MDKASVTELPCVCRFLDHVVNDERFPVRRDTQTAEYYLDHLLPDGATLSIRLYHCPICGGVASASKRDEYFADLSDSELRRIASELGHLTTLRQIEGQLGAPDLEEKPAAQGAIRSLIYKRLSKTADVRFDVLSTGEVERSITPKHIKP